MKKLFKTATVLALTGLVAFSCTREFEGGTGKDEKAEDGMGFFSMTVNVDNNSPATRAEESGTDFEQEVKNVVVLLYEANDPDGKLLYKFELDAYKLPGDTEVFQGDDDVVDDTHATRPTGDRFVSTARKVVYQDYQMVVLINYRGLGQTILARSGGEPVQSVNDYLEVGTNLLSEINTYFQSTAEEYIIPANGFFMSNANGVVPVAKTQLKATATLAESDPVAVRVDRAVAKLRIYRDFPNTWLPIYTDESEPSQWITDKGERVANLMYAVDNLNNYSYLIRQYAPYADAKSLNGPGGNETWSTSKNTSREYIYATDPNYTDMRTASEYALGDAFKKLDVNYGEFESGILPSYAKDESHGLYVPENTMELADQAHANYLNYTTCFVVKAQITPQGYPVGGTYYSFTNTSGEPKVFRHEDIVEWVDDGALPAALVNEMGGLLALATDTDCEFDFTVGSTPGTEFMTSNGITLHPDGVNVYRVPIKHFKPAASETDPRATVYGHYGVVRNNVYNVVIKSITGPGTGAEAYISADISINKWWVRDQEEDL